MLAWKGRERKQP